MHGFDQKLIVQAPLVQDLTRLFSRRFESIDTGIDRVERGVFEVFRQNPENRFLIRYGRGYFLVTADQFDQIMAQPRRQRAALLWQLGRASQRRGLDQIDLSGFRQFWHFGHIRHGEKFWQNVKSQNLNIQLMIHDVIPLDFPQTTRPDQLANFEQNFALWTRYADHIITPSQYTKDRILAHSTPQAPISPQAHAIDNITQINGETENTYLILGTIEPRKNHQILLEIWPQLFEQMGENCPKLWIVGRRGWSNEEVFKFLDTSPLMGKVIFELGGLSDGELAQYMSRARALLFPSLVEGFGLPLFEAALAEKPILASKIPAFEEALNDEDRKTLLPPNSVEDWREAIQLGHERKLQLTLNLPVSWSEYLEDLRIAD